MLLTSLTRYPSSSHLIVLHAEIFGFSSVFLDVSPHQEHLLCSIIAGSLTFIGALTSFMTSNQRGGKRAAAEAALTHFENN